MKTLSYLTAIISFLSSSLRRIILVTLIAVSLIPLAFVLPSFSENSWEPVYKDNLQKHKLLATNLVEPIKLNIESYQHELKILDIKLQSLSNDSRQSIQRVINKFTNSHDNVVSVSLLLLSDSNSPIIEVNNSLKKSYKENPKLPEYIAKEIRYQKYGKKNSISRIIKSSFSKNPILLFKHQIINKKFNKIGTLFAEIEPKFIQKLCSSISFGNKGLCAIVDNNNNTVAHPNQAWVSQIHNLSSHKLVQILKSSNVGSLEYLSSTDNSKMIGGYAKIKSLNWGIIVTRPKSEIDLPLNSIKTNALIWLIIGLVFALIIAIIVILTSHDL
jgi:archaellum component FlaF (FlaF/FlaG flagellin family)